DGGVRREAFVDDPLHRDPEKPLAHAPVSAGARMREERRHGVLEHAFVEQVDLPAAALLRRRTHELDAGLEVVRSGGGREERADDRHRDEVVTAAVSHVGKGFVLTGKRTQSVGTLVETLPRSVDAVTRMPRSGVTPWVASSAAMTSPSTRFAFTGS